MFEKYQGFIDWCLLSRGWLDRPCKVSIVNNHLVLTVGEGFSAIISFYDLDELNSTLYLFPPTKPEPPKITSIVNRKYNLDDVE